MKTLISFLLFIVVALALSCRNDAGTSSKPEMTTFEKTSVFVNEKQDSLAQLFKAHDKGAIGGRFLLYDKPKPNAAGKPLLLTYNTSSLLIEEFLNAVYRNVLIENQKNKNKKGSLKIRKVGFELTTEFDEKNSLTIKLGNDNYNATGGSGKEVDKTFTTSFNIIPDSIKFTTLSDDDLNKYLNKTQKNISDDATTLGLLQSKANYYNSKKRVLFSNYDTDDIYTKNLDGCYDSLKLLNKYYDKAKKRVDSMQQIVNAENFGIDFIKSFGTIINQGKSTYDILSNNSDYGLEVAKCFSVEYSLKITKDKNGKISISVFYINVEADIDRSNSTEHKVTLYFSDGKSKGCD